MPYQYTYDIRGTAVLVNLAEDHHHCPAQTYHQSHLATALAAADLLVHLRILLSKGFQLFLEALHLVSLH